jgi:predicted DNA-binding transcriptional regulator YafY
MRQMDRRLLILMRLREEAAIRASDLAKECGCSVRTIYRDLDALAASGVPVAAMPGEGYRLVPGYHLPPLAFSADEAVQLLLGADLAKGLGTPAQREATKTAAAKVEAVLRPETRATVNTLRDRIRVSGGRSQPSPWLGVLQQAVLQQRVLYLRYHSFSPDDITERKVEPHGLIFYSNDWHMVGYCRLREAMRDFRASRIREAELLPETFERLDEEKWSENDMRHHDHPEVRVWIDETAVPWAREQPAFGFEREERGEGGSTFVFSMFDIRRLVPWVLSWGGSARVLSPPEVVEAVRGEARALAERYSDA